MSKTKYTINKQDKWYVVTDHKGKVVWIEENLDKCQKAIDSGLVDRAVEFCRLMC